MKRRTGAKKEAYFGSVRFFKHLIYLCLLLFVVSPYICMTMLYLQNKKLNSGNIVPVLGAKDVASHHEKLLSPENRNMVSGLGYQDKYPDLRCCPQTIFIKRKKTVYLTFDDGPSRYTEYFLDILAKHKVKATFFVVGKSNPESSRIMKRIVDEGHSIAPHTYTHVYNKIYASVDSFLDDFKKIHDLIYETTGVKSTILRFPGGTVNVYNRRIFRELSAEMLRRGYTFFDWDVSAGDATKNSTAASVLNNILNGVHENGRNIVLMHDTSGQTLKALESAIIYFKNKGFAFDRLTNEIEPVTFYYNYLKEGGV